MPPRVLAHPIAAGSGTLTPDLRETAQPRSPCNDLQNRRFRPLPAPGPLGSLAFALASPFARAPSLSPLSPTTRSTAPSSLGRPASLARADCGTRPARKGRPRNLDPITAITFWFERDCRADRRPRHLARVDHRRRRLSTTTAAASAAARRWSRPHPSQSDGRAALRLPRRPLHLRRAAAPLWRLNGCSVFGSSSRASAAAAFRRRACCAVQTRPTARVARGGRLCVCVRFLGTRPRSAAAVALSRW